MAIFSLFGLVVFGAAAWMVLSASAASPSAPSISASPANPTNATSASFTYTDSQSVSRFECRLDSAAFATCGTSRPSTKSFTGLSAGSHTFQVRAVSTSGPNTGTSSTTSYTWVIDRTAPTVSSITRTGSSPTAAGSVSWSVTFSEPVTGVASNDFSLLASGLSGSQSVTGVSGSGSSYTVTASTGSGTPSGSGSLQLRLSNAGAVKDLAGNELAGVPVSGPAYSIDKTAPTVASFNRAGASPTNAASVSWTVTFSEPVTGLVSNDFSLVASGLSGSQSVTGLSGSGSSYTVTASTGSGTPSGSGSLQLRLSSAGAVKDSAGNGLAGVPVSGPAFAVDRSSPLVTSIVYAGTSPTHASSVSWSVTFSEPVTGVASNDFSLVASGLSGSESVTGVSGSGSSYTVTASTGSGTPSGSGSLQLRLSSAGSIKDSAGNGLAGVPVNGPSYAIDKTAPTVVSINRAGASPTNAASVSWTVVFSEPVTGLATSNFSLGSLVLSGTPAVTGVSGSGTNYTVTASTGTGTPIGIGALQLDLSSAASVKDAAGNGLAGTPDYGQIYLIDKSAPSAPTINSHPANPASSTSASFGFSDSDSGVTFSCSLDGATFGTCVSPKSYTGLGQGSHTFQVKAIDASGNASGATSYTWVVDTVAPTVVFNQTPPNPDTSTSPTFKWTGSDGGSGVNHFLCKLDSGTFAACVSPDTLTGLTAAAHTFQVEAVDNAGNISAPVGDSWTINSGTSVGVPYTISGDVSSSSPLYPGASPTPINIAFSSTNAGNGGSGVNGVRVSHLTVAISSVTGGSGAPNLCTAADFALTQFSGSYPFYVPQGSSSLQSLGFASTQWPTIQMLNRTANQNGCAGATVNLTYTGSP